MQRSEIDARITGYAVHDDVGGLTEQPRTEYHEHHAADRQQQYQQQPRQLWPQDRSEPPHGCAELIAALDRHSDAAAWPEWTAPRLATGGGEDRPVRGLAFALPVPVALAHAATPAC
jgi:hypothetical protein